ncbi:MAG TPA: type I methionyl aminopeptidase [Patescibacteria group bacterium]|nr:type I methionyl aminopeptidase [Patescibacteria group bacterium]
MIPIKNEREIRIMKEGGRILAAILKKLAAATMPGVTTAELDALANDLCRQNRVKPAFLGFRGYPAALCTSVNNIIVHGIPSNTPLADGDIVGLDMGVLYKGFYTDSAVTVAVGMISQDAKRLLRATQEALDLAIKIAKEGVTLGDLGNTIAGVAVKHKLGVVRELTGHGIGRDLQEEPSVPNYGTPGKGLKLKMGMTIAVEPMFTLGMPDTKLLKDNWSVMIKDSSLGAHFEHTIAIEKNGCRVLTN